MSRKHKPKKKPTVKTARDARGGVHKYYKMDESHSLAVPAGRCEKCKKITDCSCDKCNGWCCAKHLVTKNEVDFCEKCLE